MQQAGIPAWKRLGLKLKYAKDLTEDVSASNNSPSKSSGQDAPTVEPPKKKRRVEPQTNGHSKPTGSGSEPSQIPQPADGEPKAKKLKKRVSFSVDTKVTSDTSTTSSPDQKPEEATTSEALPAESKKAKSKTKTKPKHKPHSQQLSAQKPNAALDYLNQYYKSRSDWKFNKNREVWILKHAFSENDIPREYDFALAKYIHGLQGSGARERLKTQCWDQLRKEESSSPSEDNHAQDEEYSRQFREALDEEPGTQNDRVNTDEYMAWLRQQSRARLLLWSLGIDDQATGSNGTDDSGAQTKPATKKKRKNRTLVVDYDTSSSDSSSSSSESDSDSDSDTDSDEGDQESKKQHQPEEETSSSGSSEDDTSSDSDSESESDD
ncbi:hypothetical protein ABEF95_014420 [Exophiala dermatitidis]